MIERIKLTMRKEFVDDVRVVQKEVVERKEVVVERRVQRKRPAEYVDVERIEYVDQPGPGVTIEEVTETFEREVVKIVDRIEYIDEEVEKIVEVEKVVEVPVEVHVQKERIVEEVVYEDTIVDVLRYVHVPVVQHVEVEVEELEFVETKVYSRDLILKEVVVEVPSETETIEKTVVVEVRCLRLHTRKASPFLRARSSSLYPPSPASLHSQRRPPTRPPETMWQVPGDEIIREEVVERKEEVEVLVETIVDTSGLCKDIVCCNCDEKKSSRREGSARKAKSKGGEAEGRARGRPSTANPSVGRLRPKRTVGRTRSTAGLAGGRAAY